MFILASGRRIEQTIGYWRRNLCGLGSYVMATNTGMYFSRDNDVPKILTESIRCNRLESIIQNLHLHENSIIGVSCDWLYKLGPLMGSFIESLQKYYGVN